MNRTSACITTPRVEEPASTRVCALVQDSTVWMGWGLGVCAPKRKMKRNSDRMVMTLLSTGDHM
jgi:hypothetical protein